MLHVDRLMMKLVVTFRNSENAAKNADRISAIHSRTLQLWRCDCDRVQSVDGGGDWGKMNWKDMKGCGMVQSR